MSKVLGIIIDLFNKILEYLHITDVLNMPKVQELMKVAIKTALVLHPEYAEPVQEISQKVVDGIDGKLIPDTTTLVTLVESYIKTSGLTLAEQAAITALLFAYQDKILEIFNTDGVTDELAKLTELRALAIIVNNAAGGTAV